jgi:ABC-2 type transport system ATP-binding protein
VTAATSSPSGLALATRGLQKRYGARIALSGLDLAVPTGVVYGFLGPNGAGKTTTMRLLVGLIRPNAGEIELLGRPYSWRDRRRLFDVGALIETPAFYPYLSGRENLRALAATGAPVPKNRVEEVLELVALRDRAKDKFSGYSLGMKQRLGIAAALLSDPPLLLLDEPANGLDPAGIVAMRQLLRFLTSQGKTVFISSHILPEVQQLAEIVGIVHQGRLIREGSLQSLLNEGGHLRIRVTPAETERATLVVEQVAGAGSVGSTSPEPEGSVLLVRVVPARAAEVNKALAQAGIYASGLTAASDLESIFLSLTGDGT